MPPCLHCIYKSGQWMGWNGHRPSKTINAKPPFINTWHSSLSRWKLRPGDGTKESQEAAKFEGTDINRALFGIVEASYNNWNCLFSILLELLLVHWGSSNSSIETNSAGETQVLKWPSEWRRWWLVLVAMPDIENEDRKAADGSCDKLRSPRSPLLKLNWASCQTKSDGSMNMLSENIWQTASSKRCKPSNAKEGGGGTWQYYYLLGQWRGRIFSIKIVALYEWVSECVTISICVSCWLS